MDLIQIVFSLGIFVIIALVVFRLVESLSPDDVRLKDLFISIMEKEIEKDAGIKTYSYREGHYGIDIVCANCDHVDFVRLPKGRVLTDDILLRMNCKSCECKGYMEKGSDRNFRLQTQREYGYGGGY